MPGFEHRSAISRRRPGVVGGVGWLAQWMLVLVLGFDHLSAPFHAHHHNGAAVQHELAAGHHSFDDGDTHAQGVAHPLVSHAAMAIRIEPSRLAQLPATPSAAAQMALVSSVEPLAGFNESASAQWRPDRSRPGIRSHRSLPPAGRGPPVHA